MNICIDFETRSCADLKLVGVQAYAQHPSTQIMCIAVNAGCLVKIFDMLRNRDAFLSYVKSIVHQEIALAGLNEANLPIIWYAHNAMFERTIAHYLLPELREYMKEWRCLAELASACALPRKLEEVCEALDLPHKKDMEGHRLMLKMCKPNSKGEWIEDTDSIKRLIEYCAADVWAEVLLMNALPKYDEWMQCLSNASAYMNMKGLNIDTEFVRKALEIATYMEKKLNEETVRLTGGAVDKVSRRDAILRWCENNGARLPDFTKATVEAYSNCDLISDRVRRVLQIRLALGKTSVAKYETARDIGINRDIGGGIETVVGDMLFFNAASTGRWGGKLVQFQNLPKGNVEDTDSMIDAIKKFDMQTIEILYGDKIFDVLSSCTRGMVRARKGFKFLVGDYKSIEARVLSWYVKDSRVLKMYREGADLYKVMAASIFKKKKEEVTKDERAVGKSAVLGCGYGMGAARFAQQYAVDVTLAAAAVTAYRTENVLVCGLWRRLENNAIDCVLHGKNINEFSMCEIAGKKFLRMKLPSGRFLFYAEPKVEDGKLSHMGVNAKTKKWERQNTWGGILTENLIQAIAFDVLGQAVLRLILNGFPVRLTVHDEVICEVRDDGVWDLEEMREMVTFVFGKKGWDLLTRDKEAKSILNEKRMFEIMCMLPKWANGLPLEVEGWEGKRYKKG